MPDLEKFNIPSNVESIGNRVITSCTNLKTVSISGNRFSYKGGILYQGNKVVCCPGTTSYVSIDSTVKEIEYGAFMNCTKLTSVTIPNSVETISEAAFFNCSNLKEVKINSSKIKTIKSHTFSKTALNYIVIPDSVPTIEKDAFKAIKNSRNEAIRLVGKANSVVSEYAKNNSLIFLDSNYTIRNTSYTSSYSSLKVGDSIRVCTSSKYGVGRVTYEVFLRPPYSNCARYYRNASNPEVKFDDYGRYIIQVVATDSIGMKSVEYFNIDVNEPFKNLSSCYVASTSDTQKIITLRGNAKGGFPFNYNGTKRYKYSFEYKLPYSNKWYTLQTFSFNDYLRVTVPKFTKHQFRIKIMDTTGNFFYQDYTI